MEREGEGKEGEEKGEGRGEEISPTVISKSRRLCPDSIPDGASAHCTAGPVLSVLTVVL